MERRNLMESRIKLFGHPLHPMLVVIPLGLFITAVICDTVYLITNNPLMPTVSYYNILIGIIGGLVAAIVGLIEWSAIPAHTRAKAIGVWHATGNVVVVLLFAISWWMRNSNAAYTPTSTALIFSYVAIVLGAVTGWLGGELVYRLGVGTDHDANLNASNSLTHGGGDIPSQRGAPVGR
jgi:uncharacterized membrane protein